MTKSTLDCGMYDHNATYIAQGDVLRQVPDIESQMRAR